MTKFSLTFKEEERLLADFGTAFPVKGKDGVTPVKGVDYYTEEEKEALLSELTELALGDIDTALDGILAIEKSLLGGDAL